MQTEEPSYLLGLDAGHRQEPLPRRAADRRRTRESPDAYTTPAVARRDGKTEIVVTGGDVVTGHDPATGQELWRATGLNPDDEGDYRIVASPVAVGDVVVAPTRVRPMLALRAFGRGDVTKSHLLWTFDRGPDVPDPGHRREAPLRRHRQGRPVVPRPRDRQALLRPGAPGAWAPTAPRPCSPTASSTSRARTGSRPSCKAGPAFERLAENPLDGFTVSSPAAAAGQIFLRTREALHCIGRGSP